MKKKKLVIFALAAMSVAALTAVGCGGSKPHQHSYSVKSNTTQHWQECECGDKKNEANHVDAITNGTATMEPDGKCDVCGYQMTSPKTQYTVTFNMKGHGVAPAAQQVEEGSKATKPATDPADADYNFMGWFSDDACSAAFDFNSAITANTTVYAKWQAKTPSSVTKYHVTFDMKGHGTAPVAQQVEEGSKATKPATDPTDANYNFMGWFSDDACSTAFDFNGAITGNTTVYAKWELKNRTVTFNMNHIGTAPQAQSVKHGQTATSPAETPTATGFNFLGWFTAAEGGSEFDFNTPITANTVIYAHWEEQVEEGQYTVVFNMNGVTVTNAIQPQIIDAGGKAVEPSADPVAENCTFLGWFTTATGDTEFDFDTEINARTTIYAHWQKEAGYFADAPKVLTKGTAGTLTFNNVDNLYFTFTATANGRYTLSSGTCTFTTDKTGDSAVNTVNVDLNANETVSITLVRPNGFEGTTNASVLVNDCASEAVPDTWVSNTYTSGSHSFTFDWTTSQLTYNNNSYTYTYWAGSYNAAFFTDGTNNYKITRGTNGGYKLYKVDGSTETNVATLNRSVNVTLAMFAGKYRPVSNDIDDRIENIVEVWIYENGNGFLVNNDYKTKFAQGTSLEATYDATKKTLSIGSYVFSLQTDNDGNINGLTFKYTKNGVTTTKTYVWFAEAGDEIPEKLPLPYTIELVSDATSLKLVCQYGSQQWSSGDYVEIIAYNAAADYYTVTNGSTTYTLEIEGNGNDTQVKIYNDAHTQLLYTLAKKQKQVADLVTDGSPIIALSSDFEGMYCYYKVVSDSGKYTIKTSEEWLYIYYNQTEIESGNFDYNNLIDCYSATLPITVDLIKDTYVVLSNANYGAAPEQISFSVEQYVSSSTGSGDISGTGTTADPYIMTAFGRLEALLSYEQTCYVNFVAPADGEYVIRLPYNDNNTKEAGFTLDGVNYGYNLGTWGYDYAGVNVGYSSYASKPDVKITLTEGQTVQLVLVQSGWGASKVYLEITDENGTGIVNPVELDLTDNQGQITEDGVYKYTGTLNEAGVEGIKFTSSADFTVTYADNTTYTGKEVTLSAEQLSASFTIEIGATVTYAVAYGAGSQVHPYEIEFVGAYYESESVAEGSSAYFVFKKACTFVLDSENDLSLVINDTTYVTGNRKFTVNANDMLLCSNYSYMEMSFTLVVALPDEVDEKEFTYEDEGTTVTVSFSGASVLVNDANRYYLSSQNGNVYTFAKTGDTSDTVTLTVGDTLLFNGFTLTEKPKEVLTVYKGYDGDGYQITLTINEAFTSGEVTDFLGSSFTVTVTDNGDGTYSFNNADSSVHGTLNGNTGEYIDSIGTGNLELIESYTGELSNGKVTFEWNRATNQATLRDEDGGAYGVEVTYNENTGVYTFDDGWGQYAMAKGSFTIEDNALNFTEDCYYGSGTLSK